MTEENAVPPEPAVVEAQLAHTQNSLKATKNTTSRKLSKEESAKISITHYLREYQSTHNPVYLIMARKFARDAGVQVPEIIEKWLDESLTDFMYYTGVSLDVTTGLKEEKSGASTQLGEYHIKCRDTGIYDVMFSLCNLANHQKSIYAKLIVHT